MSDQCPICSERTPAVLDRPLEMPILMNRIYASAVEGRAAARGPLEFVACRRCGFTWNRAFNPALIVYNEEYENDQAYSPAFRAHMSARAKDVIDSVPSTEEISYLEVGCGQGRFLGEVARSAGDRLRAAEGFDPAWRGEEGVGPEGSRIYRRYFDIDTVSLLHHSPNVVATRHTIEHVQDPIAFLRAIREALGQRSQARIWVETPCVSWILRNRAMHDFFYEHCSLFTENALAYALAAAGFASPSVTHVFGGQYLWGTAVASENVEAMPLETSTEHAFLETVRKEFINRWKREMEDAANVGKVALWGAGAKGVSFSLLIDPEQKMIDHVIDVNPGKQGHYLPGSGLRVISPRESAERRPGTVFVMNPNYLEEISETAQEVGLIARLVAID
jgi:SAM-dependent methyltransferase